MPDVFECDDANLWDLLLESNPSTSVYLMWEYGETLCRTYGYKKYYLTYDLNGDVVGALPLIHVKSMLFGNRLISLPFCEYGGPFLRPDVKPEKIPEVAKRLLNAANDLAAKLSVDYIELRHPPIASESVFIGRGYNKFQSYVTFQINLTREKMHAWASLNKKTRNAVRKSQKSGLQVEDVNEPDQLNSYYTLYLQTQKRLGSPPHSDKLFQNLFSAFSANKRMRMILAMHQGKPVAGITLSLSGNSIFWWNNVSDMKHRNLNPTNLLLWNTIEWGIENGYKTMDLGRTRKFSTIYDFKRRWGGEEEPLIDYVRFLSFRKKELDDPSQRKYQLLSRIWRLLPIAVTRRTGPRIIKGIAL